MKSIFLALALTSATSVFAAPPASIPETCGQRQMGGDMTYVELPIYIDGRATVKYSETVLGINGRNYAFQKCGNTVLSLKTLETRVLVGECQHFQVSQPPSPYSTGGSVRGYSRTGYGLDQQVAVDGNGRPRVRVGLDGSSDRSYSTPTYSNSYGSDGFVMKTVIYGFHKDFDQPKLMWESAEASDINSRNGIWGSCKLARESMLAARQQTHVDIEKVSGYKSSDPYKRYQNVKAK